MQKQQQLRDFWKKLAANKEVETNFKLRNGRQTNIGFINQFSRHERIPNKWFDWENRADAQIMIIGQDWGPYCALLPYIEEYSAEFNKPGFDYVQFLFRTFSSRTEKFIIKAVESTYAERFGQPITKETWDRFIFTVAIFFTRQGKHFRGNEFYDEKFGVKHSLPYLEEQIKIVHPRVIIPLGGTAWNMVREIFELHYPAKITDVVNSLSGKPIIAKGATIIPNFHPASHTDPKVQKEIWKTIWEYIN